MLDALQAIAITLSGCNRELCDRPRWRRRYFSSCSVDAGGIATDDALRSLVISHHLLGTQEAFVIGHTDCGMLTFSNEDLRRLLGERQGVEASHIDFQPFPDVAARVQASVRRLRESGLLPETYGLHGFVYDVASGRLQPAGG